MCSTSIPNLGTKDVCFPKVLSGWQLVLSQQGIQENSRVRSGVLAAVPSSDSPAPTCRPHLPPQGPADPNRKETDLGGSHTTPARLHLSHTHHTQPS